jgi:hypothetical protein
MASESTLPPKAQAAAVRSMLAEDSKLTLEGIETDYPNLAEGAKIVLEERQKPQPAKSGAALVPPMSVADIL